MGAETSAVLTEAAARRWVDAREWQRGQPYLRRLSDFRQRPAARGQAGTEYLAAAQGQERYRVRVTVAGGQVVDASCSCPVGSGACKHVAALLARLTQGTAPFVQQASLGDVLDALDRPALERLVQLMLARAPELESLVYTQASLPGTDDLTPLIQAAFADLDHDDLAEELLYREEDLGSDHLDLLLDELGRRLEEGEGLEGPGAEATARSYLAVLEGVQDFYGRHDIDFGLDSLAQEAVAGLYALFTQVELEGDVRQEALEALMLELTEGRAAFDDEFHGWVLVLRPGEQAEVRRLLEGLSRGTGPRRASALGALLDLRGGPRTDADEEALLRAGHDQNRLALFLVGRGRVAEAVEILQGRRGRLPLDELRGPFEQAGALAELERLALSRTGWEGDEARLWLHGVYLGTGRREQAHALAWQEVTGSARDEWLACLRRSSADWPTDRGELIARLGKRRGMWRRLLELLLVEGVNDSGLADQAFALVSDAGTDLAPELALRVAALPSLSPDRAALLRVQAAQRWAAQRHRRAYAEAAASLRPLLERLGERETRRLVAAAFPELNRLPALRDELQQAGLL